MEMTRRMGSGVRRDDEFTGSVVGCNLVKERVAQAVGVRIPVTGPLVGGQRCRPERVRAVVAVDRQDESLVGKPLPPVLRWRIRPPAACNLWPGSRRS